MKPILKTLHGRAVVCVFGVVTTLCACPRGQTIRQPVDTVFPAGQAAVVERVTVLASRQPIQDAPMVPRDRFRGEPGRALPRGSVVVRLGNDVAEVADTSAKDRVDMKLNPWVFVRVDDAPLEGQRAWRGWIHTDDLSLVEGARPSSGDRPDGFRDKVLKKPGSLCKKALSTAECPYPTHPSLFVRFIGCDGEYVHSELWDPSGLYLSGFIQRDDFVQDPCAVR